MAPEALCIRAVYPRVHIHMYGTCKCMLTWMRAFGQRHYPAGLLSTFSFYRLGLCAFLHPHQCNGDTWTKLVPMGNAEARWWLLRNKWHHCRAKIILFTYVRHFFCKDKMSSIQSKCMHFYISLYSQTPLPSLFEIKFYIKNMKFYNVNNY